MKEKQIKEILQNCEPPYSAGKMVTIDINPPGEPYLPVGVEAEIDWYKELDKKKPEWNKLGSLALDWVSCACGNMCDIIPRDSSGKPYDDRLAYLGSKFYGVVILKSKVEALHILDLIEKRSAELIAEIKGIKI